MKKQSLLSKLFKRFRIIYTHPTTRGRLISTMIRTASWLFTWKILRYKKIVFPFLEHSELIADSNTIGCAGAYICSLYEYEDMAFLLHFIRKEDIFYDIGANIGWFTVLAAKECGCKVVSFEPIPKTFSNLKTNVALNKIESYVTLKNLGVGADKGELSFICNKDVENCVATPSDESTILVEVTSIDIQSVETCPTIIKIDVEGFETNVLKGAKDVLENQNLKVLLIELAGHGKKYGFDENILRNELIKLGFQAVTYNPIKREIFSSGLNEHQNTIFIRDTDFIMKRIKTAKPFRLFGKEI
jgi:FkbM family methyltransferase